MVRSKHLVAASFGLVLVVIGCGDASELSQVDGSAAGPGEVGEATEAISAAAKQKACQNTPGANASDKEDYYNWVQAEKNRSKPYWKSCKERAKREKWKKSECDDTFVRRPGQQGWCIHDFFLKKAKEAEKKGNCDEALTQYTRVTTEAHSCIAQK